MQTSSKNVTKFSLGRIEVHAVMGHLAVFFCLTPWASWGTNSLDSQPFPLLIATLYLLFRSSKICVPKIYLILLVWTIILLCVAIIVTPASYRTIARAVVSYLTVPIVLIFFRDFVLSYRFPIRTIIAVNVLWLGFGLLESINPSFTSWASVLRTTEGRGVTSLAPEPTFFAIYLVFSSWLILVYDRYRPKTFSVFIIFINILAILFLAKSSMGIVFLIILFLAWYAVAFGFTAALFITFLFAFVGPVLFYTFIDIILSVFEGTRIGNLLQLLNQLGITGVISLDASVNIRLEHIIIPIHAFIQGGFAPNGLEGFADVSRNVSPIYSNILRFSSGGDKINSWIGAVLFETGLFGLIFIIILIYSVRSRNPIRSIEISCILILLFAAIPLAFSVVPLLFVTLRLAGDKRFATQVS